MVILGRFLAIFGLLLVSLPAWALPWPQSPALEAKAWVLLDARSGQILAARNENERLPPASLTKMMTLYLAFEDLRAGKMKATDPVKMSRDAYKIGGSSMFLEPNQSPTVADLLHGISTLSGNDACISLALHMAGSEAAFAERMNAKARALGMANTHFIDSTGSPAPDHYSTALDMALLGIALWRDFPDQYPLFKEREFTFNNITQPNRNRLLWSDPRVDGIKTGHTVEAGFCLVASGEQHNLRLVSAIFGTRTMQAREEQSAILLDYGFNNFVSLRPAEDQIHRRVEVFEGEGNSVELRVRRPFWLTVPAGLERGVSFRLRYDTPLTAPIKKGQKLGEIEAVLLRQGASPEVIGRVPMVADREVAQSWWVGRKYDQMRRWWRSLVGSEKK